MSTEAIEKARHDIEEMHQRGPNAAGRTHEVTRILRELVAGARVDALKDVLAFARSQRFGIMSDHIEALLAAAGVKR